MHAVAAEIHERAPSCCIVESDVAGLYVRDTEARFRAPWRADRARGKALDDAAEEGMVAVVEGFHQDPIARAGGVGERACFFRVRGDRLLAKDVLACGERCKCPFGVSADRQGDVHGVDVGLDHGCVVIGCARESVFTGEGICANSIARGDEGELHGVDRLCGIDERRRRDACRAQHAEADRGHELSSAGSRSSQSAVG